MFTKLRKLKGGYLWYICKECYLIKLMKELEGVCIVCRYDNKIFNLIILNVI